MASHWSWTNSRLFIAFIVGVADANMAFKDGMQKLASKMRIRTFAWTQQSRVYPSRTPTTKRGLTTSARQASVEAVTRIATRVDYKGCCAGELDERHIYDTSVRVFCLMVNNWTRRSYGKGKRMTYLHRSQRRFLNITDGKPHTAQHRFQAQSSVTPRLLPKHFEGAMMTEWAFARVVEQY